MAFFVDVTHLVRFALLKIEMLLAEVDRYTFIACMTNTCDLSRFATCTSGKLGKTLAVFASLKMFS